MSVINYGSDLSSNFSKKAENLLGIPIYEHGTSKMAPKEIKDFHETLKSLHKDYPEVFGNELQEIHLIHDEDNIYMPNDPSVLESLTGISNADTLGATVRAKPGIVGQLGINMENIKMFGANNNLVSKIPGTVTPSDVLNHEFGHALHNFLSTPLNPNASNEHYKHLKDQFLTNFEEFGRSQGITPESIGSSYSSANNREYFAEVFARARSGTGPGFKKAAGIEKEIRYETKGTAQDLRIYPPGMSISKKMYTSKMLRNAESAIKGLLDMRK